MVTIQGGVREFYRRQHGPLLGRGIAHDITVFVFIRTRLPTFAKEKAAPAALLDVDALVAAQESESGIH
jgi:hypothetical protein